MVAGFGRFGISAMEIDFFVTDEINISLRACSKLINLLLFNTRKKCVSVDSLFHDLLICCSFCH
jgi:hypothetical protein